MKIELFNKLCTNYNKTPNEEIYLLFNEALKDYDELYVEKAINLLMVKEKFFPNLATIMDYIQGLDEIIVSEEEKIKRWNKKGIRPKWLDERIKKEPISKEEHNELKKIIESYKEE